MQSKFSPLFGLSPSCWAGGSRRTTAAWNDLMLKWNICFLSELHFLTSHKLSTFLTLSVWNKLKNKDLPISSNLRRGKTFFRNFFSFVWFVLNLYLPPFPVREWHVRPWTKKTPRSTYICDLSEALIILMIHSSMNSALVRLATSLQLSQQSLLALRLSAFCARKHVCRQKEGFT